MVDNYEETINWLFEQIPTFQNVGAGAYKPGLERALSLAAAFGNPHRRLRTIHVAGTNGKGSTSSDIAAVLTAAGYRTALFTSPHLVDFRERIRIDGHMIPREDVLDFIRRYRAMDDIIEPSFFELTTVMAFDWFARSKVDFAVIEAGLGGRLDSTNIITPLVSVITNISLDHTALLGDTPEAIASEKAGIIKPGVPVVVGHATGTVRRVFEEQAARAGAPIIFAEDSPIVISASCGMDSNIYHTLRGDFSSPLSGECQVENTSTALNALAQLPVDISDEAIARGMENVCLFTGLTGRWTVVNRSPLTIADTGHNPGGWEYLGRRLHDAATSRPLSVVLGFVNDKDISHILDRLPRNARYYFTRPAVKRGRPAADVAEAAAAFGLHGDVFDTVADAFSAAHREASADTMIFVGGSSYVVADFLSGII